MIIIHFFIFNYVNMSYVNRKYYDIQSSVSKFESVIMEYMY